MALGAGFVRDMAFWHWDYTYDFPVIFSWKLGQELNQGWFSADWRRRTRFADWRRAQEVVIYPSPFDPSCAPRANSSWKACFQVTERGFERAPVLSCSCLTDWLLSLTPLLSSTLWRTRAARPASRTSRLSNRARKFVLPRICSGVGS